MGFRALVVKRLSDLLGVLSHAARLRIVEEIGAGEQDVNSLAEALGIPHSGVSQHLSLMRAHSVVVERRVGRHVLYRLRQPEMAGWLLDGLRFIEPTTADNELRDAVDRARVLWGEAPKPSAKPKAKRAPKRGT